MAPSSAYRAEITRFSLNELSPSSLSSFKSPAFEITAADWTIFDLDASPPIPDKVTVNADSQKVIVTIFANNDVNRITVDKGETITADLLKSHITIAQGYEIDGFYTDAQYTTEFDFSKTIDTDTSIYAKISKVENTQNTPQKDETPKTGVENYLGIALCTILFSLAVILFMKKKDIRE